MTLILNFYANRNKVEIVSCLEQESKMNDFVFFKDTTTITWAGKKREKPFLFQSYIWVRIGNEKCGKRRRQKGQNKDK